jgi:hypothetical protein
MFASALIIVVSVAFLLYWFRYTCMLILDTRTAKDYSVEVAQANQLSFAQAQNVLDRARAEELDGLARSLEADLRRVTRLLDQASSVEVGGVSLERVMLRIDFSLMKACYRLSHKFEKKSQKALEEMSQIVAHLANTLGERAAVAVRE